MNVLARGSAGGAICTLTSCLGISSEVLGWLDTVEQLVARVRSMQKPVGRGA